MARIIFVVLFLSQLILGFSTVYIVQHWDEAKLIDSVIQQYSNGNFLPTWYNYPSVIFYISYFDYFLWDTVFKHIINDFNIFNRSVFYGLSCLPAVFIFNVFQKKQLGWIGLTGAMIFFASWEFHYHSRWVAPDTISALFGMASIYFLSRGNQRSLLIAAVMAGLAFGTKYTAGIFILPVVIITLYNRIFRSFKNISLVILVFAGTFFITTPGILIEWKKAYADILFEQQHYSTGHHAYTVYSFPTHLKRNLVYLTMVLPTKNIFTSVFITLVCLTGSVALIRLKKYVWLGIGTVILCFLVYLSTQKVMFVRNLMVCWPVMCLLAGYGIFYLFKLTSGNKILLIGFILLGLLGLSFTFRSDIMILQSNEYTPINQFVKYAGKHAQKRIWLSNEVSHWLVKTGHDPQKFNTGNNPEYFAIYLWEAQQWKLPANEYNWVIKNCGPEEVNINYYPTYQGNLRIIVVKEASILKNAGMQL